jgi:hypothetical protein
MGGSANLQAAVTLYDRVIEINTTALGANHTSTAETMHRRRTSKRRVVIGDGRIGEPSSGGGTVRSRHRDQHAALGVDHIDTAATMYEKARALVKMGGSANLQAAAALYDRALSATTASITFHCMRLDVCCATCRYRQNEPCQMISSRRPALADVFSRPSAAASTTATDHRNSPATHRSPSKAERHVLFGTDPGASPQSSRNYATAINRGSGAESASLDFLRHRAEQREELGVAHWLTRHRQEVTEADQRRMENRLRAEHLFATAQLAAESFRDASTLGEEHAAEAAWTALPLEKQSAAGSSSSAQYSRRANTPPRRSSPSPPPPPERNSITSRLVPNTTNTHGAASSGLSSVERSDAATAEMRRSPPPPPPEALNEEANYAAKVRALALPAPQQAYPSHRSTPPPAGSSLFGQRSPSPGQTAMSRWLIDGAEGTAAATSRTRLDRSERADRNVHSDTIHLLRKAVTDRDEQIVRLERRLREQQQHFDASIQDARREHDAALRHADQRAALLETEINRADEDDRDDEHGGDTRRACGANGSPRDVHAVLRDSPRRDGQHPQGPPNRHGLTAA